MTQVFIFGSSNAYGVGGENGGWPDLMKQQLHQDMYTKGGTSEQHEVFNFGKSGATVDFVSASFSDLFRCFRRDNSQTIGILSVGSNDARAESKPDNFTSSLEHYQSEMTILIKQMSASFDQLFVLDYFPIDESKTMPFVSPTTGIRYYYSNKRRFQFSDALEDICRTQGIVFLKTGIPINEWIGSYLYEDGLHPNGNGHQKLADMIMQSLSLAA
jgi:lysophospholipase L1-like esterase